MVNIYERGDKVSAVGDGISIWKRSWQVLQELGLEKDLEEMGSKAPPEGSIIDLRPLSRPTAEISPIAAIVFRKSDQPDDPYDFYRQKMPCKCLILKGGLHDDNSLTLPLHR